MADKNPSEAGVFHTVVVSTDGTPFAMRAVDAAFRLAKKDHAKIIVISVIDTSVMADFAGESVGQRQKIERELEINADEAVAKVGKLAEEWGVDAEMIVKKGRPHIEIVTVATQAEADLIVMGKRSGHRAARHPVGGVTQRVVEDADCAILIVP